MSVLLFVDSKIPDYKVFIDSIKVPIGDFSLQTFNPNVTRIGFVWENTGGKIPFCTNELINYLKLYDNKIIVDLITCQFNSPFNILELNMIKKQLPNVKINYSINQTGNLPNGDWIMESSGDDLLPIYFNKNIINYTHTLLLTGTILPIVNGNYVSPNQSVYFTKSKWTQWDDITTYGTPIIFNETYKYNSKGELQFIHLPNDFSDNPFLILNSKNNKTCGIISYIGKIISVKYVDTSTFTIYQIKSDISKIQVIVDNNGGIKIFYDLHESYLDLFVSLNGIITDWSQFDTIAPQDVTSYLFDGDFYSNGNIDEIPSYSVYDHLIINMTLNSSEFIQPTEPIQSTEPIQISINALTKELPAVTDLLYYLVNTVKPQVNTLNLPISTDEYDTLLTLCDSIKTDMANKFNKPRVLFCATDGTVIVDTGKSTNTFSNYNDKKVNENHNSRIAIMCAQLSLFGSGLGVENKYSTSTKTNQLYAGISVNGSRFNNSGTIRISCEN